MEIPARLQQDADELATSLGRPVRLHQSGNQFYVVVENAPLPGGAYTAASSDILMLTDFQYGTSAMDMFYMEEHLRPAAGPIPDHASQVEDHLGRRWRRWSWHRNGRWTPGVDGLLSHWAFVEACWAKEVVR